MKEKIIRIKTGVQGLDKIINGGMPKNSFVLLTGACGTGKFTFSMNFLLEGLKEGKKGIYLSLEESAEETISHAKSIGFDEKAIKKGITILKPELYDWERLMQLIEESIIGEEIERIVINSITHIGAYFKDSFKVREALLELIHLLKKHNITTIAISERPENSFELSTYGVEEFIADGVIILHYAKKDNLFVRGLSIRKMRFTSHSNELHSMILKKNQGMIIFPSEEVVTEFK